MLIILSIVSVVLVGIIGFVVFKQANIDLTVDLSEKPISSTKVTLTSAVRGALAHMEQGNVSDVYYGIGTFGVEASKTKIRRQLRALREAGKVALTFSNGRGSYSLPA